MKRMEKRVGGESRGRAPRIPSAEELAGFEWDPLPEGELGAAQRSRLKSLAHGLKPVARIGQEGPTDRIRGEIRRQLLVHELVKVKWSGLSKEDGNKKEQSRRLARWIGAHFIHLIGQNLILFRQGEHRTSFPFLRAAGPVS